MLLQSIDSLAINRLATDFTAKNFWGNPDFWIFLILTILGIIVSYKGLMYSKNAFIEAGQAKDAATAAKDAANRAGKTVKKQSILLAISETTRVIGQIRQNTSYDDTYSKLMDINAKIRNIIGFYKEDLNTNHQNLLQQIGNYASDVLVEFNLLDPDSDSKLVNNKVRPILTMLSGHLNELQGVLENELISNN